MRRQHWMLAAVMAMAACDFVGSDPNGTQGELGNGVFSYSCVNGSDVACDGLMSGQRPLDASIAKGARFSVSFQADEGGSARVEPASRNRIEEVSTRLDTFRAVADGPTALLAMRGDRAVDLLHVQVVPIHQVRIDELSLSSSSIALTTLSMTVGQSTTLVASARGEGGDLLVGALEYVWSAPDAAVVDAAADPTDNEMMLQALAPGSTTVSVTVGGVTHEITIEVSDPGAGGGGAGGSGGQGGGGGGGTGGQGGGS